MYKVGSVYSHLPAQGQRYEARVDWTKCQARHSEQRVCIHDPDSLVGIKHIAEIAEGDCYRDGRGNTLEESPNENASNMIGYCDDD